MLNDPASTYVVLAFLSLIYIYVASRLASSAYFRSKRESLVKELHNGKRF